jgi:death on curing protein
MVILSVALLEGIILNHPFIDGNKRTALVAARTLLIRNGYDVEAPDDELGPLIKSFAAGHLDRHDVEDAFQRYLVPA